MYGWVEGCIDVWMYGHMDVWMCVSMCVSVNLRVCPQHVVLYKHAPELYTQTLLSLCAPMQIANIVKRK